MGETKNIKLTWWHLCVMGAGIQFFPGLANRTPSPFMQVTSDFLIVVGMAWGVYEGVKYLLKKRESRFKFDLSLVKNFFKNPTSTLIFFICLTAISYFGILIYKDVKPKTYNEKIAQCVKLASDKRFEECKKIAAEEEADRILKSHGID